MLSSGLTLIFSMMGVLNFAHASLFMLGAYLAYQISRYLGFWPSLVLAPVLVGLFGAAIERWGLRTVHRYGHVAGDRMLRELAAAWRSAMRSQDLIARQGGDEFVLVMPATSLGETIPLLRRLTEVHDARWTYGCVEWRPGESLSVAMSRADQLLYENKRARPKRDDARRRSRFIKAT